MIEFDYSQERLPRTWKYIYDGIRYSANIVCPKCKSKMSLFKHEIASDGTVNPSLVCVKIGCDFHEFIKLNSWIERDGK